MGDGASDRPARRPRRSKQPAAQRPSEVLAGQVRAVRERKRWNQQRLADRLGELGEPTDRTTIARIENGARGVSVDEALLLAAALEVEPAHLLCSPPSPPGGAQPPQVRVAPRLAVGPRQARAWLRGQTPLPGSDERSFAENVADDEWKAMTQHGARQLGALITDLALALADGDAATAARRLVEVDEEVARQHAAVARLTEGS